MDRLVFIYPGNIGGVDSYIRNISSLLQKEEQEHLLLIYSYHDDILNKCTKSGSVTELRISRFSPQTEVYRIIGFCIRENDILICNDAVELQAVDFLKLKNKLIYFLHGDLPHYSNQLTERQNLIDKVICVSNGLKNKYSQLFPGLNFSVGFPLIPFESGRSYKKSFTNKAVFLGRFQYEKGADLFLKLARELGPELSAEVIAPTTGSDEKLLAQLPAAIKVRFDLDNAAVMKILECANFLIFPSRSEGFGMAVLEALIKGAIPIVLNIRAGIPDQVIHGQNGYIFNESDWAKTYPLLRYLINNPQEQERLRRTGASFIVNKFEPVRNFRQLLKEISSTEKKIEKQFNNIPVGLFEKALPAQAFAFLKYLRWTLKKRSGINLHI